MDRFLVNLLNFTNKIVAAAIIIGCAIVAQNHGSNLFIGAVAGAFLASIFCGLISCITLIETHLHNLSGDIDHVLDKLDFEEEQKNKAK